MAQWIRRRSTEPKIPGSIPGVVITFFSFKGLQLIVFSGDDDRDSTAITSKTLDYAQKNSQLGL